MNKGRQSGACEWTRVCYGAAFSEDNLTIVRAVRSGGSVSCFAVDPADTAFQAAAGRGDVVVAGCLSERESFSRWLTAPFPSVSKALQVFPSLLDIQLPFPLEECVYMFLATGLTEERTTRTLAVAARCSELEKKLDAYRKAGLDPVSIDQEGIALWTQSIRDIPAATSAARVVVWLCGKYATVAIGRDGDYMGAHNIRQSPDQVDRILRARIQPGQALEWTWAGEDAGKAGVVESLYADLRRTWPGKSVVLKDPGTFLARAIATRALTGGPLRCNLRMRALEHPALAARGRRASLGTAVMILAAGLLLCGIGLAADTWSRRKADRVKTDFAQRVDRLAGYCMPGYRVSGAKGRHAIEEVERVLKDQAKIRQPFVDAFNPSLAEKLRTILATGEENGLVYDTVHLRAESVSITGAAASWNQCEKLSVRLKELGYSVRLDRRESSTDGRIIFAIGPGGSGG